MSRRLDVVDVARRLRAAARPAAAADAAVAVVDAAATPARRSRAKIRRASTSRTPSARSRRCGASSKADSTTYDTQVDGLAKKYGVASPVRAAHADAVPRHHGVSGGRSRRRRLRRHGSAARHSRHAEPDASRRRSPTRTSRSGTRPRSATTDRWCCSATSGAVAARRTAARTIRRTGAPTRSSRSSTARWCSRATTSCRRRRRSSRTAWRTTVR